MIHGHATPQGLFFPHAGVRISEDSATLISPEMIDRVLWPYIERSVEPFGGGFVHYCGKHDYLFQKLCSSRLVKAIDLGNPEKYDARWVLERCAESSTVLYSRIPAIDGEGWFEYTERVGFLVKETGARCVLRPTVYPETMKECQVILDLWHDITG
ncbi:MAG: hypothetical protein DRP87_14300 [Spirochaetes bacterium]|nr:MAG: hypothetical protein DRP87_14300 [Spirochaetota bacterium]